MGKPGGVAPTHPLRQQIGSLSTSIPPPPTDCAYENREYVCICGIVLFGWIGWWCCWGYCTIVLWWLMLPKAPLKLRQLRERWADDFGGAGMIWRVVR
jgi:hypothetical protein